MTARRDELAGLPDWPRGLSRVQASIYVGISPSKFDELVRDGRMPKPKRIDGRNVWDRRQLDDAFTALPGGEEASDINPWDKALSQDAGLKAPLERAADKPKSRN